VILSQGEMQIKVDTLKKTASECDTLKQMLKQSRGEGTKRARQIDKLVKRLDELRKTSDSMTTRAKNAEDRANALSDRNGALIAQLAAVKEELDTGLGMRDTGRSLHKRSTVSRAYVRRWGGVGCGGEWIVPSSVCGL
jgi:uncharacterized coiled-coil DUF342 family protein